MNQTDRRFIACHACRFWARDVDPNARPKLSSAGCYRYPPALIIDRVSTAQQDVTESDYQYRYERPITGRLEGCGEGAILRPVDE